MERRVLLAVTLSFVVLLVYQTLFVKPVQRQVQRPRPSGEPTAVQPAPGAEVKAATEGAPAAPVVPALVASAEERDVVVESHDVRAVFTNRGAELKSWTLKRFSDEQRRPVDLVPRGIPADEPRGFALVLEDEVLTRRIRRALFRPSADRIDVGKDTPRLTFEFEDSSGLLVRKEFEFRSGGNAYVVKFSALVRRGGEDLKLAVSSGPGLGETERAVGGSFLSPAYYQKPQGIYFLDGDVARIPSENFSTQGRYEGAYGYIGADDQYFLGALLPGGRNTRVDYRQVHMQTAAGPRQLVRWDARVAGGARDLRYFFGPKQFDALAAVDRDLTRVINFGIFAWLVVPLLRSLNWINGFIGNYGWSIIILTILINAVMFPLRHKSVVSMRKMQDLQPEVKAIQDRYAKLKATDPQKQKMNVELMNLYRERGVNPASGCVPMLLTFPVLFAFYALLSQAIEIRGAPFVGWITDLSKHDPWYVTPLLMGGTMVWQQRITPSTADPAQQKMMMFMPIVFTFMFLWAPSGLVIYWFVSNLWAIGQQYLTNYLIGPPGQRAVRPAPARKLKNASNA